MSDNNRNDGNDCKKHNIQLTIDVLVILDFIVSTIGGFIKNSNENIANYCFMTGGGILTLAVILTIYKYVKKK